MQLLVFILAYPLLLLISLLPFKLLYLVSDGVYIILYKLIGYRKKVVRYNLQLALPHLSDAERLRIEKKFYRHLGDIFLEMIKTISISSKAIQKRFVFTNPELILDMEKDRSLIVMSSHYACWEWIFTLNTQVSSRGYAVYKRIENPYFDRMVKKIRQKFGTTLIETRETIRVIRENQRNGTPAIYGFLSDQSPMVSKAIYWKEFMGVKVPVHVGAEVLAKRTKLAVVYLNIEKLARGHYQATFKPIAPFPENYPDFQITDMFLHEVEEQIKKAPEYYFWTHKRWKHKDKAPLD